MTEPDKRDCPVRIVPAGHAQASMLATLIRQSYADVAQRFGITPHNGATHPSLCTKNWIRADIDNGVRYYLAARDDLRIGCVALKRETATCGYLMRLAVLPLFRGQGIGRQLTAHVCREARREGAAEVSAGIIAEQEELAVWYRRQGFREVGQRRYDHLPFGVRFMRLDLDSFN